MMKMQFGLLIIGVARYSGADTNAIFKTLDYAHRSKFAYKKQDTFISENSGLS